MKIFSFILKKRNVFVSLLQCFCCRNPLITIQWLTEIENFHKSYYLHYIGLVQRLKGSIVNRAVTFFCELKYCFQSQNEGRSRFWSVEFYMKPWRKTRMNRLQTVLKFKPRKPCISYYWLLLNLINLDGKGGGRQHWQVKLYQSGHLIVNRKSSKLHTVGSNP